MNFRPIFTQYTWWGKIIAASLGYLMAGPIGIFFGIFIGNFFDQGLSKHFSRPHWPYHVEKRKAIQKIFFESTFKVMGYIAKADGRVTEHEIEMARQMMQEMELNRSEEKAAQAYFNEGKKGEFSLTQEVRLLQRALHDNPDLLKLFIDIQYRAAQVDGLSFNKQQVLNSIFTALGLAPLYRQYQFYEDYGNYTRHQYNRSSKSQKDRAKSFGSIDQAYAILGVSPNTNKQDIKRAYRRLMSRNHPDKLTAQGLPEKMIKMANEKTQAISKAYQQICEDRGW